MKEENKGAALSPKRTEYGKKVRKQYESGEIKDRRKKMQQLEPRTDGITNTLTGVTKDNLIITDDIYSGRTRNYSENCPTLREKSKDLKVNNIRRLTEIECERLQGFTTIDKYCIFEVCKQKNIDINGMSKTNTESKINANAEEQSGKSIHNAGSVEKTGLLENAPYAQKSIYIKHPQKSKPVHHHVHIYCVGEKVEIHNQEKLLSSVNIAEIKKKLALPTGIENFAHLLVLISLTQEKIMLNGEVEYPAKEQWQMVVRNGKMHVNTFGSEIVQPASYASKDILTTKKHTKYTTSSHLGIKSLDMQFQTLFYYVMDAIRSFIPGEMLNVDLLTVQINVNHGWTEYGNYDGIVKKIPSTQRYKLLGNAVSTVCPKIIAERLLRTIPIILTP